MLQLQLYGCPLKDLHQVLLTSHQTHLTHLRVQPKHWHGPCSACRRRWVRSDSEMLSKLLLSQIYVQACIVVTFAPCMFSFQKQVFILSNYRIHDEVLWWGCTPTPFHNLEAVCCGFLHRMNWAQLNTFQDASAAIVRMSTERPSPGAADISPDSSNSSPCTTQTLTRPMFGL